MHLSELSPILILLPLDSGVISKLGNLVDTRGLIMDLPVHDRGVIEEAKCISPKPAKLPAIFHISELPPSGFWQDSPAE